MNWERERGFYQTSSADCRPQCKWSYTDALKHQKQTQFELKNEKKNKTTSIWLMENIYEFGF